MEILLIKPSELTEFTPLGGNVDVDKYKQCIYDVQELVLKPLLGCALLEKIKTDFYNDVLTGDYLTLYTKYLKPILRHQVFAEYAEIAPYFVANGGIFKHSADNSEIVDKSEVMYLAQTQRSKAQTYIHQLERYLCRVSFIERTNDTCCFSGHVKVRRGWQL